MIWLIAEYVLHWILYGLGTGIGLAIALPLAEATRIYCERRIK